MKFTRRFRLCAFAFLIVWLNAVLTIRAWADNPPTQATTDQPPTPSAASQAAGPDYAAELEQVFRSVQDNYVDPVDAQQLFQGALKGLFDTLNDAHSYYLAQDQLKDLTDTTRGRFGGVGLIISKPDESGGAAPKTSSTTAPTSDADPGYVEVVSPIHGSPADRAGVSAGDRITKIEGESTIPMTIDDVVNKLRGAPGTQVTVTILRGSDTTFRVTIDRAVIEVPVVRYAMVAGNPIGYIRIIQYTPLTPDKVQDAVSALTGLGATSLIVDERGNPGGLLSAVVRTADFFLDSGTIVSTRSRISSDNESFSAHAPMLVPSSVPMIILIDKGSASAAEIFAGALHDHHRALLVGETSYGKGSVQQVFFLQNNTGAFKLTTAKYYTPDGVNIDKIGIKPDVEVKEPDLTKAQQDALKTLTESNAIPDFVRQNPGASDAVIDAFADKLHAQSSALDSQMLLRLIHGEVDRMQNDPPVYDLRYDQVLSTAVGLLASGQYPKNP